MNRKSSQIVPKALKLLGVVVVCLMLPQSVLAQYPGLKRIVATDSLKVRQIADMDSTAYIQYLVVQDSLTISGPLTANWDAGGYEIRSLTFESDVTTGTAPFTIASTTLVTNLNADLLDSQTGSWYVDSDNLTGLDDLIGGSGLTAIDGTGTIVGGNCTLDLGALTANWDAGGYQVRALQFYADGATTAGGYHLGDSTQLYQASADVIQTPDAFTADGVITGKASIVVERTDGDPLYAYAAQGNSWRTSGMVGYRARGSIASPSAILSGDTLAGYFSAGYHSGSAYGGAVTALQSYAAENFTATNQGAYLTLATTAIGATTRTERVRIHAGGNTSLGTNSLLFGAFGSEDTNLYRNAANELKTDDSFSVAGTHLTVDNTLNLGGDVYFSRGAANRLDLGDGDSFRMNNATLEFMGGSVADAIDMQGVHKRILQSGTQGELDIDPYQRVRFLRITDNASAAVIICKGDNTATQVFNMAGATGQLALPVTGSGAGILIGGDALWYRSAANLMRTPDNLQVDGYLHLDGDFNHDGTNVGLYTVAPVAQAAHIADPAGGATQDAEARTAINAILVALENIGITAVP